MFRKFRNTLCRRAQCRRSELARQRSSSPRTASNSMHASTRRRALDRFARDISDPSVIVLSEIQRCQHPHSTQFFQKAKHCKAKVRASLEAKDDFESPTPISPKVILLPILTPFLSGYAFFELFASVPFLQCFEQPGDVEQFFAF